MRNFLRPPSLQLARNKKTEPLRGIRFPLSYLESLCISINVCRNETFIVYLQYN